MFYAVVFTAALTIPDPTVVLPLLAATAVTAVLTPALHVQLVRHSDVLASTDE